MAIRRSFGMFFFSVQIEYLPYFYFLMHLTWWPRHHVSEINQSINQSWIYLAHKRKASNALRWNDLKCVEWDVKPCSVQSNPRVAFRTGIIFTNFVLGQLIRVRFITFILLIRYVMLWPSPWSSTFLVYRVSHEQTLYEMWAKSSKPHPQRI